MAEINFSDAFATEDVSSSAAEAIAGAARGALGETVRELTEPSDDREDDRGEIAEKQSPEEDSKYAAARRKAERERDRKIREVKENAEKEMDDLFADLGMIDPYTNEQIRNKADFIAWKARFREDLLTRADAPEGSRRGEPQRYDTVDEKQGDRLRAVVEGEMAKIRRWEPDAKDLSVILNSDRFPEIYEKVMRGYSLSDAYYLAKAENHLRYAGDKAKESAALKERSKDHLNATAPRGGGEVSVPAEVMAEFKRLMPDATKDEIRAYYRKDRSRHR